MKALFGMVSLLIALAILGVIAVKQLRAGSRSTAEALGAAQSAGGTAAAASGSAPLLTPAQQSQQLQQKVKDDIDQLMQQAPTRGDVAQ